MKKYIKGNYRQKIFQSNNGYIIGLFKIKETNDEELEDFVNKSITFTGYFADLNIDDTYLFYGELVEHPKYGTQYQVTEYERVKIEDTEGIVEFLSSDLFPGVGLKMAHRIVDVLGMDTLTLIMEDKNNLKKIPKLNDKTIDKIYDILTRHEESHTTIVYLTELGFTMKDALTIYNKYKQNTIPIIENNVYDLIDESSEITFTKIDNLRGGIKIDEDDPRRIKASIIYIMRHLVFSTGDTYLYLEDIIKNLYNYLGVAIDPDIIDELLDNLQQLEYIVIKGEKYYLKEMYEAEESIALEVYYLTNLTKNKYKNLDSRLSYLEEVNNITYSPKQKEAIIKSLENHITIITGGPGTGKTTIIKAITKLYQDLNDLSFEALAEQMVLLAPTGRASKRMSETTLFPSMTIHRFLKWDKESNLFGINEENPEYKNLVIIDEVSMIDTNLLSALFKGLGRDMNLVLVGDINQLPSVGPGQVLKDLIASDIIPTTYLDLIYRTDEDSYINILASEIKDGSIEEISLDEKHDFRFLQCQSINPNLIELAKTIKNKGYNYKNFQIMAPMYKGENGIDILNKELQQVFNPSGVEMKYGDVIYREGDKVIQLVNMPDDNIYNGDVGIIKKIETNEKGKHTVSIDFDNNIVKFTKDFNNFKHAFIISIHKSQGSEFDLVIIPFSLSYKRMLYRKLVYTGITRAKKKLILLGDPRAFMYGISNTDEYIRKTSLIDKIDSFMNK